MHENLGNIIADVAFGNEPSYTSEAYHILLPYVRKGRITNQILIDTVVETAYNDHKHGLPHRRSLDILTTGIHKEQWPARLYNSIRKELPDIPKPEVISPVLQGSVSLQNITVKKWGRSKDVSLLECEYGHEFEMNQQMIYYYLNKRRKVCPKCRKETEPKKTRNRPKDTHTATRWKIRGREQGYTHNRQKMFTCDTCSSARVRNVNDFKVYTACRECKESDMEDNTIRMAHDGVNAFVWIGRTPFFLQYMQGITIEPVFGEIEAGLKKFFTAETETIQYPSGRVYKRTLKSHDTSKPLYEDIYNLNVSGANWMPGITDWISDDFVRLLAANGRTTVAKMLPVAIDYVQGKLYGSRYNMPVLNTQFNSQFIKWENGVPRYEFDLVDSPISKGLFE